MNYPKYPPLFMLLFGAILACGVFVGPAHAQFSDLDLKMTEAERDSILSDYSNFFPLYGREIVAQGFRLPKPLGLNFNYFVADQAIEISNLQLGVNGSDLVDVSDYILFDDAQSYAQNVNLRADLWLFPFLNLYGIAGYTDARTTVKLKQPITLEAGAEMSGPTYGGGFNLAFSLMGYWMSLDRNWTWSDFDIMDEPIQSKVFGMRVGKNYKWAQGKSMAAWVGAMRVDLARSTSGSVVLGETIDLPPDAENRLEDWLTSLPPSVESKMREILNLAADTEVYYALDKAPTKPWTMLVGGQLELSRSWQVRTEFNFLGSRTSVLLNLVYRLDI